MSDSLALPTLEMHAEWVAPQEYETEVSSPGLSGVQATDAYRPLPHEPQGVTAVQLSVRAVPVVGEGRPAPAEILRECPEAGVGGELRRIKPGGHFKRYFSKGLRAAILAGMPPVWLFLHNRRDYIEAKVLASPPWVDMQALFDLHVQARNLTRETGVFHNLDHIVPLRHPMVCGLNVPWNIQIITAAQNAAKSNKWSPDQMDLL